MHKQNNQRKTRSKRSFASVTAWVLLIAMLLQVMPLTTFAAFGGNLSSGSSTSGIVNGSASGIGDLDGNGATAQLKKEMLSKVRDELLMKIEDYELTGEVDVILTFSDASLLSDFTEKDYNGTYVDYQHSDAAMKLRRELEEKQSAILGSLMTKGLISEVQYQYQNVLDGAFVTTTYEQIGALYDTEGVICVTVSDTYLPAAAVENPVYVYDTGIFNSSDVKFTGKDTVVAILDTGCDYTHSAFTTHTVVDPHFTRDDIAALLYKTVAYSYDNLIEAREVYYGNITGGKIAFGYDYADKDPDIMPYSSEHGTHVAGIIGGKDDVITGVAIDTQFAIMKVFSDYEQGAKDGWIIAALEDSVVLGVDAINMSLGLSCGFSKEYGDERDLEWDIKNTVYERIGEAGISLVVAASNDHSSGYGNEQGNTSKAENPDSATVGSPSTYEMALSVASINGNKDKYLLANGQRVVFYIDSYDLSSEKYDFYDMLGITESNPVKEFEYVTIPGVGMAINYAGLDMTGKIALVKRGDITFEEKIKFAYEAGAIGVIIYNNVSGDITMTAGNDAKIPAVSISKDDGEALAAQKTGTLKFDMGNKAGPFMSDFSSWGPTPDLRLKPEITAHGGNILSAIPGGDYDELSGTSMAAPNMCGITVLIRQFVKENYQDLTKDEPKAIRDLVNQLCMSTATIALDKFGTPYSPRKQGAGIADIIKATTTPAYLHVDGIGKTKLELGDDPSRTGVYTMEGLNLQNLSDQPLSYRVGIIAMTESLSSSDPEYVAETGYLLAAGAKYTVENGEFKDGVITVAAGETAKISVTLTLTDLDKAYIDSAFENGMYVEGFVTFDNTDEDGVDLNVPYLAFYGDWAEAPLFDLDYYEEETEAHNNAIDEDDKIKADYYATLPLGSYYYDYILPLGSYLWKMDETEYTPIPATAEKAAVSYYKDCISGIYGVLTGLLRGASKMNVSVKNVATGEEVWTDTFYNCGKAHWNGAPMGYFADIEIPMIDAETGEVFGYNNTKYEVTMTAMLDWNGGIRNASDTYTFSFYIDYEAPIVTDAQFYTEYDKAEEKDRYYVDVYVYDNHYAMALQPVIVFDSVDEKGRPQKVYSSLSEHPIPIYQEQIGDVTKVKVEITDYLDQIRNSSSPEGITFYINDYALNDGVAYIPFPETNNAALEFVSPTLDLPIGKTVDLNTRLARTDNEEIESEYLKSLTWTSSDESVVRINDGEIETLKSGTATIRVTSSTWTEKGESPLYKTVVINVSEEQSGDPSPQIEDLVFSSYETLFAFNSDIDFSSIGKTGSTNYFGKSPSIEFYPSEQIKLHYRLDPWNLDLSKCTFKWSSSNPRVATVDENGVVTAVAEGKARITLQIAIDGKTSLLAARCSLEVKSEFIIENRTLVAYKGQGGDVVIPNDEGILYIGAYAFSHFYLDNEREVEKDEDGNYDIDDKKDPLGNDTITSVKIPEGVDTIRKYAFYNCKLLERVILPESTKIIEEYAFHKSDMLENINLEHVQLVSNYAFYNCKSLTGDAIGGIDLSHVSVIGEYAFAGTRLKSVDLSNLRRSGKGAFSDCSYLEEVTLGKRTRISDSMFMDSAVTEVVAYSDIVSDSAFKGCTKLTSIRFCNDLTYLGREAFYGCKKLSEVVFEGECEQIATSAFVNCTALENLTLPNGKVVLGDEAFSDSGLKNLVFAENTYLENVGVDVFEGVRGVQFNVDASANYKFVDSVLYSKDGKKLVMAAPDAKLGDYVVPKEVEEIGAGAFSSNATLLSVSFEDGSALKHIGYGAFSSCDLLGSVTLPKNAITIDAMAFHNSEMLRHVNLETVVSIGDFAFQNTALTAANMETDGVKIGYGAFYNCSGLRDLTIPANASVGANAFHSIPASSVTLLGNGVTLGSGAFYECVYLQDFDFSRLTGKVGAYAFYGCRSLKTVNMPNVTEIGASCFVNCPNITTFSANNLEVIGKDAFTITEDSGLQSGASFTTVSIPKVRVIGENAFYGCLKLTEIDLSNATSIGKQAFGYCVALERVTLSEDLATLREFTFYNCVALKEINLEHVKTFEKGFAYGVQLPADLNLAAAEHIGEQAFIMAEGIKSVASVFAPELLTVDSQAFAGNVDLVEFHAPKLESVGYGAFAYTAIEELEISPTFKFMDYAVFEGCEKFETFFTTVNGERTENAELANVMLKDGVLYTATPQGYVLTNYPVAKEGKTFTVADGTIRIEYTAAMSNKNLETVILPESLRAIGNLAFYGCENLKTVVFNSYYAPTLEGTLTGETIEITPETIEKYPGFSKLYKYDYYYKHADVVAYPMYYATFIGTVASDKAVNINCITPANCENYDSVLYNAFFASTEQGTNTVVGPYALAFIEAAEALPETADRFDKALIGAAVTAYNALLDRPDEMANVDPALIEHFLTVRSQYNVSVAENKIAHLFTMAKNEYSFEKVKDARTFYLALSETEKAEVSNADRLETKLAELTAAMGMEPDFSKTFKEHYPDVPGDEPDPGTDPEPKPDSNVGTIILIVAISVVAVAAIAVGVILVIKKKRTVE